MPQITRVVIPTFKDEPGVVRQWFFPVRSLAPKFLPHAPAESKRGILGQVVRNDISILAGAGALVRQLKRNSKQPAMPHTPSAALLTSAVSKHNSQPTAADVLFLAEDLPTALPQEDAASSVGESAHSQGDDTINKKLLILDNPKEWGIRLTKGQRQSNGQYPSFEAIDEAAIGKFVTDIFARILKKNRPGIKNYVPTNCVCTFEKAKGASKGSLLITIPSITIFLDQSGNNALFLPTSLVLGCTEGETCFQFDSLTSESNLLVQLLLAQESISLGDWFIEYQQYLEQYLDEREGGYKQAKDYFSKRHDDQAIDIYLLLHVIAKMKPCNPQDSDVSKTPDVAQQLTATDVLSSAGDLPTLQDDAASLVQDSDVSKTPYELNKIFFRGYVSLLWKHAVRLLDRVDNSEFKQKWHETSLNASREVPPSDELLRDLLVAVDKQISGDTPVAQLAATLLEMEANPASQSTAVKTRKRKVSVQTVSVPDTLAIGTTEFASNAASSAMSTPPDHTITTADARASVAAVPTPGALYTSRDAATALLSSVPGSPQLVVAVEDHFTERDTDTSVVAEPASLMAAAVGDSPEPAVVQAQAEVIPSQQTLSDFFKAFQLQTAAHAADSSGSTLLPAFNDDISSADRQLLQISETPLDLEQQKQRGMVLLKYAPAQISERFSQDTAQAETLILCRGTLLLTLSENQIRSLWEWYVSQSPGEIQTRLEERQQLLKAISETHIKGLDLQVLPLFFQDYICEFFPVTLGMAVYNQRIQAQVQEEKTQILAAQNKDKQHVTESRLRTSAGINETVDPLSQEIRTYFDALTSSDDGLEVEQLLMRYSASVLEKALGSQRVVVTSEAQTHEDAVPTLMDLRRAILLATPESRIGLIVKTSERMTQARLDARYFVQADAVRAERKALLEKLLEVEILALPFEHISSERLSEMVEMRGLTIQLTQSATSDYGLWDQQQAAVDLAVSSSDAQKNRAKALDTLKQALKTEKQRFSDKQAQQQRQMEAQIMRSNLEFLPAGEATLTTAEVMVSASANNGNARTASETSGSVVSPTTPARLNMQTVGGNEDMSVSTVVEMDAVDDAGSSAGSSSAGGDVGDAAADSTSVGENIVVADVATELSKKQPPNAMVVLTKIIAWLAALIAALLITLVLSVVIIPLCFSANRQRISNAWSKVAEPFRSTPEPSMA